MPDEVFVTPGAGNGVSDPAISWRETKEQEPAIPSVIPPSISCCEFETASTHQTLFLIVFDAE